MRYVADLHVHSKYSRSCSKNLTLSNMAAWARAKGIDVLATSDFTHPRWIEEIETKLEPAEDGLFKLRENFVAEDGDKNYISAPRIKNDRETRFILSTEVCCIYKKGGKTRRLHLVIIVPTLAAAKKIISSLEDRGKNLKSDGRPILGMDAKDILKIALEADARSEVIPAHAWTPWFSIFGSQSGFDSLEECFDELTPHIHAIETGLSSDPPMNWRWSALDRLILVSNSDAHGLKNLGREANVFELDELNYNFLLDPIRHGDANKFKFTIEFFPEEGKYHVDGHRDCQFRCPPEETIRLGGKCLKCGKPLTRGVLGRVHSLADRAVGQRPTNHPDFRSIVPLTEIIADAKGKTKAAKAVEMVYRDMVERLGSEFDILLDIEEKQLLAAAPEKVVEGIMRMRRGNIFIEPGYDGEYGTVKVFQESEVVSQTTLDL